MANLKRVNDPDPDLTAAKSLMTRRDTISGAAKLVAGLSIGAQVMAATGADNAMAKQVRHVARRAGKPGYGPLVNHTGEMSLPKDFHYTHFGGAGRGSGRCGGARASWCSRSPAAPRPARARGCASGP